MMYEQDMRREKNKISEEIGKIRFPYKSIEFYSLETIVFRAWWQSKRLYKL